MNDLPLFDAHNDTIILRAVRGEPLDFAQVDPKYHVDLPRLRRGNVAGMNVMVGDLDLHQSVQLIDALHEMAILHPDDFAVCGTREDVTAAEGAGRIALVMSIESQAMFREDLALLRQWHRLGVRVASLTHGEGTFGGPSTALQHDGSCNGYLSAAARGQLRLREKGLTPFARESLKEMARLDIVLDLTHANDAAFWEALELYEGPVCCTHSNCFALCPTGRNLTDEMMRAMARRDGVMALCAFGPFVDQNAPSLEQFANHIEHALDIMGEDRVGFGSDFDGIPPHTSLVIDDAADVPLVWEELRGRGLSEELLRKVARDNLLALFPAGESSAHGH